jgi:hypothetical protein
MSKTFKKGCRINEFGKCRKFPRGINFKRTRRRDHWSSPPIGKWHGVEELNFRYRAVWTAQQRAVYASHYNSTRFSGKRAVAYALLAADIDSAE